jgi:hypothetical protein
VVREDTEPIAAFTVKHELIKWLGEQEDLSCVDVWRCGDGLAQLHPGHEPVRVSLVDLLPDGNFLAMPWSPRKS